MKEREKKEIEDYLSGGFKVNFEGCGLEKQINTNKSLMRRVSDNPKDIAAWIEYIQTQDKVHFTQ